MGKPFKIILSTIIAMVLLLITSVCILSFVIDPNDFKPEIAATVKNKTGRELALDGDLKFSLFPWIGISTGKIVLGNAPGFQDQSFATLDESHVNVLLLPLLSKKIEVSSITLKGLVINLARNKQGITNWADLGNFRSAEVVGKQDEQQSIPTAALAAFAIGGIAIENARINWDDLKTDQHIELKDLNLNIDKFAIDKPVGIVASLIAFDSRSKSTQAITLNTELSVNGQFDSVTLRRSLCEVTSSGKNIPGTSLTTTLSIADAVLNTTQQTAIIHGLQLKSGDIAVAAEITGTHTKDKPSFQGSVSIASFNPAKVLQQLAIALPAMQDNHALNKLSINFDLATTTDSADLQNLLMSLDDTQIKGSASIKDFDRPAVTFTMDIDTLDVDRYLPPVDKSSKPIASPAVLLAIGTSILPVETLRKLNVNGAVSLGKLKVNDLAMQDIDIKLNAKNGVITTQQSIRQFYQGSYRGDLSMDTQGEKPMLTVNEKIDRIQIEPLLKDYKGKAGISGSITASAHLQGQGKKTDELKASLNGQLSFLFKDGTIKGFNLQKIINEGKALIKGSALPADYKHDQTLFSEMSGTATITNGLIQNNNLTARSSKLRVDGKGNINLNSEALDYKIDAKLLSDDMDAEAEATTAKPKAALTINIAGTLDNPSYTIDIASLLTDNNKAKIEKLINKLDKKIGPGLGNLLKNFLK